MKNLFLVSCFLSVLLTKAQDTLLIKSQITFDQSGKPISSSVYDYNKQGINIALTEIKHEEKDTIFHRTIFRKKKELYFIYYNSKSPTIRDTTFFEYNNDTTIIRTKNNSYETLHKRLPNGKFFYSASKTFDKFTSNHQVDSIFYDSTKNIIHTVTYKMNGSPTSFQSGTRELSSGDLNEVRPNKQIPIGGVLKEKWEYKNEKNQLILEIEEKHTYGSKYIKAVKYDETGRFIQSDAYFENDTNHQINYTTYDTINDTIYTKSWNNWSLGYRLDLRPVHCNHPFFRFIDSYGLDEKHYPSISYSFAPNDELLSEVFWVTLKLRTKWYFILKT